MEILHELAALGLKLQVEKMPGAQNMFICFPRIRSDLPERWPKRN